MTDPIWFVCVTYYPKKEDYTENFRSIGDFPIIIVDNSPTPDYENHIKKKYPNSNLNIIKTHKNLGYGGAANLGFKYALEKGAECIVVINQDIIFSQKALKAFCGILNKNRYDIIGPFTGELDKRRWTSIEGRQVTRTEYIPGSCLAIKKDVFDKIGNFYEPYFMYYEDVDFSIRAKNYGFSIAQINIAGISHKGPSLATESPFLHQYYLARNHLLFVERLAPWSVKLHEMFRLPKTIYEHISRQEKGALLGIRDYFLRRFGQYKGES